MTLAPASPSVTHRDALDVQLVVTFTPSDPIGLTVVEIAGDEVSITRYLQLVEAAAARLAVYAADYRQQAEADTEAEIDSADPWEVAR